MLKMLRSKKAVTAFLNVAFFNYFWLVWTFTLNRLAKFQSHIVTIFSIVNTYKKIEGKQYRAITNNDVHGFYLKYYWSNIIWDHSSDGSFTRSSQKSMLNAADNFV